MSGSDPSSIARIDWGERTLRVERAWNLGRVKATKTYEERTVDLTPELVQALALHMNWLKAESLKRGWGEPEWLFPNDEGKPHDEARVRKVFKHALTKAKLPAFRLQYVQELDNIARFLVEPEALPRVHSDPTRNHRVTAGAQVAAEH